MSANSKKASHRVIYIVSGKVSVIDAHGNQPNGMSCVDRSAVLLNESAPLVDDRHDNELPLLVLVLTLPTSEGEDLLMRRPTYTRALVKG